ncbi:MAG: hypothetical protein IJM76_05835 [Lachnospiraceae bacterium]|nr:hypothetical protein [Lachnospiraceae bacterium]
MRDFISGKIKDEAIVKEFEALGLKSGNPSGMTIEEAIKCAQIMNAVKGDRESYKIVTGEKNSGIMPLEEYILFLGVEDGIGEQPEEPKPDKPGKPKQRRSKKNRG